MLSSSVPLWSLSALSTIPCTPLSALRPSIPAIPIIQINNNLSKSFLKVIRFGKKEPLKNLMSNGTSIIGNRIILFDFINIPIIFQPKARRVKCHSFLSSCHPEFIQALSAKYKAM